MNSNKKIMLENKKPFQNWNGSLFYLKILDYAKTSFTLFAASSKVIAE